MSLIFTVKTLLTWLQSLRSPLDGPQAVVLIFGLVAGGVLGMLLAKPASWLNVEVLAQVLAAVGTLSAVLVALRQARRAHEREDRRIEDARSAKREDDLLKAKFAAMLLRRRLLVAAAQLHRLADRFDESLAYPELTIDGIAVNALLGGIRESIGEPNLPLLNPLSPRAAHRLGAVIAKVEWQLHDQKQNAYLLKPDSSDTRTEHLVQSARIFRSAANDLDITAVEYGSLSDIYGP